MKAYHSNEAKFYFLPQKIVMNPRYGKATGNLTRDLVTFKQLEMDMTFVSYYSEHLEKWYSVFPWDRILILNGKTLIKEPWKEIQKVINRKKENLV